MADNLFHHAPVDGPEAWAVELPMGAKFIGVHIIRSSEYQRYQELSNFTLARVLPVPGASGTPQAYVNWAAGLSLMPVLIFRM